MSGKIATTPWSQVLVARDGSESQARAALESLCQTYWQPLYAYIRHQGASPDEAIDLTRGFFAELVEKDFLANVDPEKGRFRSFLLASLHTLPLDELLAKLESLTNLRAVRDPRVLDRLVDRDRSLSWLEGDADVVSESEGGFLEV